MGNLKMKVVALGVLGLCGLAHAQNLQQPSAPVVAAPAPSASTNMPVQHADDGNVQRNILKRISEKRAERDLLVLEAEVEKLRKSSSSDGAKSDAGVMAALDQAKRDQGQNTVDQGPAVTLLATYGMPDVPGASYAEFKVGDLLVNAKVGDRLPSGHYVKAVNFDSVELSKSKTAKKGQAVYITASDTASVYASRSRSGAEEAKGGGGRIAVPSSSVPVSNLPPMPTR